MFRTNKVLTGRKQISRLKQCGYLSVASVFAFTLISVVFPAYADAYGQLTGRSIQLSSTASSATNVAYKHDFTTVTTDKTVGSVVVYVCSNSPIIGDSCSAPTGFNWNSGTTTLNNVTGNITGLSIHTTASTANKLVLTRGLSAGTVAAGAVSFTMGNGTTNGSTNMDSIATFYAKIILYSTTDGSGNETTDPVDAGGIAMSLANQLNVTAKVQEALFFCVFTGALCSDGGTAVALGDANGVLVSNTTTYTATANFEVSSNAVSGVSVRLKGDTLKSGSFSIDPFGAICTADSTSSSVEQFGLRMSILGAGQTASAPYNCLTGNHGFDINATTGTTSLFGQEIAKTSGASDKSTSTIEFAAKSANTTEAGIYTTKLTLVATAKY